MKPTDRIAQVDLLMVRHRVGGVPVVESNGSGDKLVGVLISGRGTNLQALIDAQAAGRLGGRIALVISNEPAAGGLERARRAGVPTADCDHRGRPREAHDEELRGLFAGSGVQLVCLAGYMRLLSAGFIRAHAGRILNVHPSLLPAFPGLDAPGQAIEHGVRVSGATVHLVEEELDACPIVLQEAVPVMDSDTRDTLAARILEADHRIYPLSPIRGSISRGMANSIM